MDNENVTLVRVERVLIGMQIVERDGALLEVIDVIETHNAAHYTLVVRSMMGEVRTKVKAGKAVRVFNAPFQSVLA